MSTDVNVDLDVGAVDLNLNGLDNINADVDLGLDNVNVDLGLDNVNANLRLELEEIRAQIGLTLGEIKADFKASIQELAPIFLNFLWKEIPLVKIGFPHRYRLGLSICGKELVALTFCGESEIITEKNVCPEPCGGHHEQG